MMQCLLAAEARTFVFVDCMLFLMKFVFHSSAFASQTCSVKVYPFVVSHLSAKTRVLNHV